jgi:hypothetical protein
MPPSSRKQQKLIFALAHKGTPWAAKYVADAPTMRVQQKGKPMPKPEPQYAAEKRRIVKEALRKRRG